MYFQEGKRSLLEREKGAREIEKCTQEALQDGYPGNWGPTALPELCTTPSLLEDWGEGEGNWVQSFACSSPRVPI